MASSETDTTTGDAPAPGTAEPAPAKAAQAKAAQAKTAPAKARRGPWARVRRAAPAKAEQGESAYRRPNRVALLVAAFIGVALVRSAIVGETSLSGESPTASHDGRALDAAHPPAGTPAALPHSAPVRLEAPSIGLAAPVVPLGRGAGAAATRSTAAPSTAAASGLEPRVAGWLRFSAAPGQRGTAVLVGGTGTAGTPGAFRRLRELAPGDTVRLTRQDGRAAVFQVYESQAAVGIDDAAQAARRPAARPELRLLTSGDTTAPAGVAVSARLVRTE
ncbi:class F sortase [Streptomyces sp. NPDC059740]|uniref:class F sortase n=1 Tax=Streptomyces sp. NPDC059740 TaxID=3346926 RepID=UPI0036678759